MQLWAQPYGTCIITPNPVTDKEEELTFMEQKVALMKERDLSTVLRNN